MARGNQGALKSDGQSVLPGGLFDMAELGRSTTLDPDLEEKLAAAFDEDSGRKGVAKFKLEVCFTKRSMNAPFFGMVTAWTNGGFLHGGGDEVVYFCPAKVPDPKNDAHTITCAEPLHLQFVSKRVAVCPKCKTATNPKNLVGQVMARLPVQHWVTLLTRMFMKLEGNADIIIEHIEGDLRVANEEEQTRDRGGELYDAVRAKRKRIAYPLSSLIKDTNAGADISSRIRALLTA